MERPRVKPLAWIGSSKRDLKRFPGEVQDRLGFALYGVQTGRKPPNAKPLKGFGGAGVLQLIEDHDGDTYRAVCTVRFSEVVYMLHAFQKKSEERNRYAEARAGGGADSAEGGRSAARGIPEAARRA